MSVEKLTLRYAKSLLALSIEKKCLDAVLNDIRFFKEVAKNKDFVLMLQSPIINIDKKQKIVSLLFENKIHEITFAFLKLIVHKRREGHLPEIVNSFIQLYNQHKNITAIKIITAVTVNDSTVAEISKIIKKHVGADTVEIQSSVNKDLIGGFVLQYDDKLYDASIAYQLKELKKQFSNNQFIKN